MDAHDERPGEKAVRTALDESGVRYEIRTARLRNSRDFEVSLPEANTSIFFDYHPGLAPVQIPWVRKHLEDQAQPGSRLGLVVRQLSATLLEMCRKNDIAVVDLHGNAWLRLPGVYIDRWRPVRTEIRASSGTVFTAKASRIVRAFLHRCPQSYIQSQLAKETGLSRGYVSTLVARMVEQTYVTNRLDLLYLDEPDRLLDDWLAHYRFDRHRKQAYALTSGTYEEGISKLADQLQRSGARFAFTGWTAAHIRAPYATPSQYMAYVSRLPDGMNGVFPVEGQGNVSLLVPHDEGVFQYTTNTDYGPAVSDTQIYLDLCRMPGRALEQADALRHSHLDFASRA